MISLLVSFLVLIAGFIAYGRVTEKIFGPDDRETPAVAVNDGVDCVPMNKWKAFLVQLLNIAGTGPIFGALMGAVFGPVVFLWIATAYLLKEGKYRFGSLLKAFPAAFMTAVSVTYIFTAKEGLRLDPTVSRIAGTAAAILLFVHYMYAMIIKKWPHISGRRK